MAGTDFRAVLAKAQLDAAKASAVQLAQALREAESAAAALNKRGPMTPEQEATAEVKRLAAETRNAEREATRAAAAFKSLSAAQARSLNGFSSGKPGATSPWAKPPPGALPKAPSPAEQNKANAARKAATGDAGSGGGSGAPKDLKYLLKQAGIGKAAMGTIGAAGALELTKLALGMRGMAQLQALTARAGMQVRQLFRGVDPSPIVRAADRFFQLFNPMTAAGKGLSQLFGNVFNGFFGAIEKAQPYVSAFVKGLVIGALDVDTAWMELRIAMLPVQEVLEEATAGVDGIGSTADVASAAFRGLASVVKEVADGVAAITAAYRAMDVAVRKDTATPAQKDIQDRNDADAARRAAQDAAAGGKRHEVFEAVNGGKATQTASAGALNVPANDVGAAGATTGKAYADGLAKGVADGQPGVEAAGAAAALALDAATRKAGKIQSPSRLGVDTGGEYPAGLAIGIDGGRGDVQDAADRSMVPKMGGQSTGAMAGQGGGAAMAFPAEALALLRQIEINTRRGGTKAGSGAGDSMRDIALQLGVNVAAA